ncbi:MAG: hypothetical protein GF388_05855 [Candidatus Aegiribacteria sp.]|nr:hypothetical protein [Candidatus Aegiribacteria sp.]
MYNFLGAPPHPYNVALITVVDGVIDDQCSGTLIEVEERRLIATCAHFLRDNSNKEIGLVCDDEYRSPSCVSISRIVYITQCSDKDPVHNDIGYAEISKETAEDLSFLQDERFELNPVESYTDLLFQSGFPANLTRENTGQSFSLQPIYTLTEMGDQFRVKSRFIYGRHVLSAYPSVENAILPEGELEMPDLHGMSGGGLWVTSLSKKQELLWTPSDLKLTGINVEFSDKEEEKPVLGVSLKDFLDLVTDTASMQPPGAKAYRIPGGRKVMVMSK